MDLNFLNPLSFFSSESPPPEPTLLESLKNSTGSALKFIESNVHSLFFATGIGSMSAGAFALYKGETRIGKGLLTSGGVCVLMGALTSPKRLIDPLAIPIMQVGSLAAIGVGTAALYNGHKKKGVALIASGVVSAALTFLVQNSIIKALETDVNSLGKNLLQADDERRMNRIFDKLFE